MRKLILLSSVMAAVPFLTENVNAADCVTQDCSTLGYTDSADTDGCLKCPFGNMWFCQDKEDSSGNDNSDPEETCSCKTPPTCTGEYTSYSSGSDTCGNVCYVCLKQAKLYLTKKLWTCGPVSRRSYWRLEYSSDRYDLSNGLRACTDRGQQDIYNISSKAECLIAAEKYKYNVEGTVAVHQFENGNYVCTGYETPGCTPDYINGTIKTEYTECGCLAENGSYKAYRISSNQCSDASGNHILNSPLYEEISYGGTYASESSCLAECASFTPYTEWTTSCKGYEKCN